MAVRFTDDELKALKITSKLYRDTKLTSRDPFDESNAERFSLSAYWVGITTGDYNSDVAANFTGKKGSGKSYSCLEIARMCAIRTSIKLNNDDGAAWKDYFDVERNVAVMDAEKLMEILTSNEKYQVIIGDDVGTIQGARQYRSEQNQAMNNVFVVNRTLRNIYMSSAPETKHVDRQARDLPEHQLDFQRNDALMSIGFACAKLFTKVTDPKTSESYHKYHYWRTAKVARILIPKPPKEMCDEYDRIREIGKNKIQEALKMALESKDEPRTPKVDPRIIASAEKIREAQERVNQYHLSGMTGKEAVSAMCNELNIKKQTWYNWVTQGKATAPPKN